MKTKKMLFKAAVCLMVVVFMFSSVSALAADYVTYTTYNLESGNATVKTVVTGVTSGEVAYLAYEGPNPEVEGAIFHIDQTTGTGSDVFEYTVAADKIAGSHSMLVGTQSEGKLSTDVEEGATAKFGTGYTLTVNVANCKLTLTDATDTTQVPNTKVFAENGTVSVGNGNVLAYAVEAKEGYDVDTAVVTLDGVEITGTTTLPAIAADATLSVTVSEAKKESAAAPETEVVAGEEIIKTLDVGTDEISAQSLVKYGTVTLGEDDKVASYGIEISDGTETQKYYGGGAHEDLARTEGKFAIVLEGLASEFEGTLTVKTFVITESGKTTYGAEYTYADGNVTLGTAGSAE